MVGLLRASIRARPNYTRGTGAAADTLEPDQCLDIDPPSSDAVPSCHQGRKAKWRIARSFADESLPVIDAEFGRTGNSLSTVEERVPSDEDELILSYWDPMAPFVPTVPPGAMNRPMDVYSTFLPARSAQLSVNDKAAIATVFMQERFGKPASSCCLAWSEPWTKPRG
jgi:hypothetical protein